MFRFCISALRFSRVQGKVRSGVSSQEHARKDRIGLPYPTHLRMASPPFKPALHKQTPGGGGSKPAPPPVVSPRKVRV